MPQLVLWGRPGVHWAWGSDLGLLIFLSRCRISRFAPAFPASGQTFLLRQVFLEGAETVSARPGSPLADLKRGRSATSFGTA